jgi:tetratricopeptide (TPR) repeat protein
VQKFGFSRSWIDSSLSASRKAISINPNLAEAYKSLGLAYGEKGLYRQALDAVRKAVDLNPNYYPAVANIGWAFWLTGKLDEALIWMKKGLDLNPAFAYSYLSIGVVYLRLGEFEKARSWFDKALELQPDFTYGYVGNALAFQAEGKIDQALEEAGNLQSRFPDDPIGLSVVADINLFGGNTKTASELLEKVVAMNPDGINIFTGSVYATRLVYVAGKTGDQAKAQALLQKALRLDRQLLEEGNESASRRYDLACIASLRGDRHEALTWLQRAVDAGWRDYLWGMNDPLLESLHRDQTFRDMMDSVQRMVAGMRDKVREMESQ